jgi:hypothetical protein
MKVFSDLKFEAHPVTGDIGGKRAVMDFKNGYGVSVIHGPAECGYYCGEYTFEVAVRVNGRNKGVEDVGDIIGYTTPLGVSDIMRKLQSLPSVCETPG